MPSSHSSSSHSSSSRSSGSSSRSSSGGSRSSWSSGSSSRSSFGSSHSSRSSDRSCSSWGSSDSSSEDSRGIFRMLRELRERETESPRRSSFLEWDAGVRRGDYDRYPDRAPDRSEERGPSERRGPSAHSASSHSSAAAKQAEPAYKSHYVQGGSMRGSVIARPRTNQPTGFTPRDHGGALPVLHYCRSHNYAYYPEDWTDPESGRDFRKGYYDEDGRYYEDVAFLSDGVYKNLVCKCEYCDSVSKIEWKQGQALTCPCCGGTMKPVSALDEYTRDPLYEKVKDYRGYVDYADRDAVCAKQDRRKIALGFLFAAAAVLLVIFALRTRKTPSPKPAPDHAETFVWDDSSDDLPVFAWDESGDDLPTEINAPADYGDVICLRDVRPGVCAVVSGDPCDRRLVYDAVEESWYDELSGLWAWYNTDVEPPLWQYWYEPISGDYSDYGWMEYEDGKWYVEIDGGEWTEVPREYDTSPLWHIEN